MNEVVADSIESKSGIHSCLKIACRGKTTIRVVHVLFGVVIIFIVLAFIMPWMGRIRPNTKRFWRSAKLQNWHEKIESFFQDNKRLPSSLFEMCRDDLVQGIWTFPPPFVSESRKPFEELVPSLATDPNRFAEIVEYGLFSGQQRWFIRELKPGKIYKKMLMIDQDGKIYVVEEMPKEKYSKP